MVPGVHPASGAALDNDRIWPLLHQFFREQMHRQTLVPGALEALNRIGEVADVVILTNLGDEVHGWRVDQLAGVVELPLRLLQLQLARHARRPAAPLADLLAVAAGELHLEAGDRLFAQLDVAGEANALSNVGNLYDEPLRDYDSALDHLTRALNLWWRFPGMREVAQAMDDSRRQTAQVATAIQAAEPLKPLILAGRSDETGCPVNGEAGIGEPADYAGPGLASIDVGTITDTGNCGMQLNLAGEAPGGDGGRVWIEYDAAGAAWFCTSDLEAGSLPTSCRD